MNEKRRKKLKQAAEILKSVAEMISDAKYDEQDCMNNMPENLQDTDRYAAMEDAVDAIDDADDFIRSAIESLNEAAA